MLLLNVSCPQAVRCLRIVERPQSGPFDACLGEELLPESRIAVAVNEKSLRCLRSQRLWSPFPLQPAVRTLLHYSR